MTQEFHISVTPVGSNEYLVRTERVAPGVPLAEEQVVWSVEDWLAQARQLMYDPLLGLLQGNGSSRIGGYELPEGVDDRPDSERQPPLGLLEFGQQLYGALFQGTLRDSWMTAQGIAQHRGEVLRLRLGLKGSRLPRLPWEVLHGGNSPERLRQHNVGVTRPIATGTDVIFSRYQPGIGLAGAGFQTTLEPDQPLRILMAIAAPTDQKQLELKREATHLQQELRYQNGSFPEELAGTLPDIQLTILDQPGREQLTQALEQGQYQVFHYAGHSNLGVSGGDLYLVNSKTGLTETLSGDDLAGLLVNNGIRMTVFNSCRGAYTAAGDPTTEVEGRNLAEALVSRGIPAVLAMAERIPDDVALTLTRLFYRNLKQGYPVDLSLSRARQGLISAYSSHQLYWALPMLYLHPDFDGYLTPGDRTLDNPADSLVRLPQVYDLPTAARQETAFPDTALPDSRYLEPDSDWTVLSEAVLSDDDLSSVAELEYEDEVEYSVQPDSEDLSYEEDSSLVADLIQQLSHPELETEEIIPAVESETLLPEPASGLAIYQSLPENPLYHQSSQSNATASVAAQVDESKQSATSKADVSTNRSNVRSKRRFNGRVLLPLVSAAGVTTIALLGFWLAPNVSFQVTPSPEQLLEESNLLEEVETAPELEITEVDLKTADTATVTSIAISHFSQNEIAAGHQAVEELLDRGALPQAEAALAAVSVDQIDDPTVSFLRGRLAWQSFQVGDTEYEIDDVRRYWETAAEGSDSPLYYEALGFAYYAEGKSSQAIEAWLEALSILEQTSTPQQVGDESTDDIALPTEATTDDDTLTAYAGIALALQQASADPASEQSEDLSSKAIKLHQMVTANDPINFQPEALSRSWLWTESAIQDWRSLSEIRD